MRRILGAFFLVGCIGFGAGQLSAARAGGTPYQAMDCAPLTLQHGVSNKGMGFETWDEYSYCTSYYLDSAWTVSGTVYYYPYPGWGSRRGYPIFGASSVFSTHNVVRDWYNGYVGTSDY